MHTNALLWICFHLIEVLNWSFYFYESHIPLFTIIMNNLIPYQKFLNERRRTIYVSLFYSIVFYLVNSILLENFVIQLHLKSIFDMLELFITGWIFLLVISPKKFQNRVVKIAGFAGFSRFTGKSTIFWFCWKNWS